jgi:hypothetical protein
MQVRSNNDSIVVSIVIAILTSLGEARACFAAIDVART